MYNVIIIIIIILLLLLLGINRVCTGNGLQMMTQQHLLCSNCIFL